MKNYVEEDEMQCPCCGKSKMDKVFMVKLNAAREMSGIPFQINSGWRCLKHNEEVGSKSLNHVTGKAADIRCLNSHDRFMMLKALLNVGMQGIGIGSQYIHADTNRETPVIWTYFEPTKKP